MVNIEGGNVQVAQVDGSSKETGMQGCIAFVTEHKVAGILLRTRTSMSI